MNRAKKAAVFVDNMLINKGISRQNVEYAFSLIATLVTSKDAGDRIEGFDTLFVLTEALEDNHKSLLQGKSK